MSCFECFEYLSIVCHVLNVTLQYNATFVGQQNVVQRLVKRRKESNMRQQIRRALNFSADEFVYAFVRADILFDRMQCLYHPWRPS